MHAARPAIRVSWSALLVGPRWQLRTFASPFPRINVQQRRPPGPHGGGNPSAHRHIQIYKNKLPQLYMQCNLQLWHQEWCVGAGDLFIYLFLCETVQMVLWVFQFADPWTTVSCALFVQKTVMSSWNLWKVLQKNGMLLFLLFVYVQYAHGLEWDVSSQELQWYKVLFPF